MFAMFGLGRGRGGDAGLGKDPNVGFYQGAIKSSEGSIEELHKKRGDYVFLESSHAYVQWFFPNYFPSRFNYDSQELTPKEAAVFRSDRKIAERYLISYEVFLDFLGLKLFDQKTGAVGRKEGGEARLVDALIRHPHNQLRIRRILASLAVTGFRHYMAPLVHHLEWEMTGRNEYVETDGRWKTYAEGRQGEPCLAPLAKQCLPAWYEYVNGDEQSFLAMTRAVPEDAEVSILFRDFL